MTNDPNGSPHRLFVDLTHRDGGAVRLTVAGEIDLSTSDQLADALATAFVHADVVELELTDVPFMDSSGVRALTREVAIDDRRRLVVVEASTAVRRLLEITRLDEAFGTGRTTLPD